jgi:hypothetical protein
MGNVLSVTDTYYFTGVTRFKVAPIVPANSFPASALLGPLPASLLQRMFNLLLSQTGTVVAATEYKRIVRGATATLLAVQATITETIATGSDRTVTIDVKKSTGGGAFASVLGSPIVLDHTATLRAVTTASISSAGFVTGDILQVTVTVAGSAGNQALGLSVNVDLAEDPV